VPAAEDSPPAAAAPSATGSPIATSAASAHVGAAENSEMLVRLADGSYAAAGAVPMTEITSTTGGHGRRRFLVAGIIILVVVALAGTSLVVLTRDHTERDYLAALEEAGFDDRFAADRAAVARASEVCAKYDAGAPVEGYKSDKIAVEYYCDDYLEAFTVVPTPEERAAAYTAELEEKNLAGQFADDDDAVLAAERFCKRLDNGAKNQGLLVDRVAVEHYCDDYASDFKVLEQRTITGSFVIFDSDPSLYFPSIDSFGSSCEGSGGYSDLGSSTAVVVTNADGKTLARTQLGLGSGGYFTCRFEFSVELTEGESSYIVAVGDRGEFTYTWSEIKAEDAVMLSIGD
jgi:hypothetical protein